MNFFYSPTFQRNQSIRTRLYFTSQKLFDKQKILTFCLFTYFHWVGNICSNILACWQSFFMQTSSALSSCRIASTDLPGSHSLPFPITYRFRQIFQTTNCIGTEQLFIGSSWLSNLCSSMCTGPQEFIAYEFVSTSMAVSVKLLFCRVLPPGLVPKGLQHSCVNFRIKVLLLQYNDKYNERLCKHTKLVFCLLKAGTTQTVTKTFFF